MSCFRFDDGAALRLGHVLGLGAHPRSVWTTTSNRSGRSSRRSCSSWLARSCSSWRARSCAAARSRSASTAMVRKATGPESVSRVCTSSGAWPSRRVTAATELVVGARHRVGDRCLERLEMGLDGRDAVVEVGDRVLDALGRVMGVLQRGAAVELEVHGNHILVAGGDVLGPPVPVVVVTVSGANRDPDRAQSEHRRDHIARGLDPRRDQRQTPRRQTRTELGRDQDDGGGQRGNRRPLRTRDRLGLGCRVQLDLPIIDTTPLVRRAAASRPRFLRTAPCHERAVYPMTCRCQ